MFIPSTPLTGCLCVQCLVYHLQEEGLHLREKPYPSLLNLDPTDVSGSENWSCYDEWVSKVTQDAVRGFLRGAELGCVLKEAWLVANAASYLWNYSHHWVASNRLTEVVLVFRPLMDSMKKVDASRWACVCLSACMGYVETFLVHKPCHWSVSLRMSINRSSSEM